MEQRGGDAKLGDAIAEQMPVSLFKMHTKLIFKWNQVLQGKPVNLDGKEAGILIIETFDESISEDVKQTKREFISDQLNEAGFELYSVYMQLGALDTDLMRALKPKKTRNAAQTKKEREAEEYSEALKSMQKGICRVEFVWNKRIDLLFFPKPRSVEALSAASRDKVMEEVDMETAEYWPPSSLSPPVPLALSSFVFFDIVWFVSGVGSAISWPRPKIWFMKCSCSTS